MTSKHTPGPWHVSEDLHHPRVATIVFGGRPGYAIADTQMPHSVSSGEAPLTKPMRATEATDSLHSKLVQEVRSEAVEPVEDITAGQYVFTLLSACASVCALPRGMFAQDDINDIRNVRANLARLLERLS